MKDKISTAKAAHEKKEDINNLDSESPGKDILFDDLIDLEGIGEAWLGLLEEDTLFNMQDCEGDCSKKGTKKRTKKKKNC